MHNEGTFPEGRLGMLPVGHDLFELVHFHDIEQLWIHPRVSVRIDPLEWNAVWVLRPFKVPLDSAHRLRLSQLHLCELWLPGAVVTYCHHATKTFLTVINLSFRIVVLLEERIQRTINQHFGFTARWMTLFAAMAIADRAHRGTASEYLASTIAVTCASLKRRSIPSML